MSPRIAILGLFGECNAFRAPIPEADYRWMAYFEGESLIPAVADPDVFLGPDLRGFFEVMNATGPWTPVPILVAESASGPPLEENHFQGLLARMIQGLKAAGPVDGVFIKGHGSVVAEQTKDVDAVILSAVREEVGLNVPVIEVLDPHGKVTPEMVRLADLLISYRTDPHVDIFERGQEAAHAMRRLLGGDRIAAAYVRMPIMVPTLSMVAPNAPFRPAVDRGVAALKEPIANVSILPSYPWTDTPFAGFHVLVSSWNDAAAAENLALDLATYVWNRREGFQVELLSLDAVVAMARDLNADATLPPVCFADVADNPGGGGTANTTHALEALLKAGVKDAVIGPMYEPRLAALAHAAGVGASLDLEFNVGEEDVFATRFKTRGVVTGLSDGATRPRSGVAKGMPLDQGPTAAFLIDGITVVVNTVRLQGLAVEQLETAGVDLSAVRMAVVKSRGHYQAAFAEFFDVSRMLAIDTPGWMTTHLDRLPYRNVPRPLYPMDPSTTWSPAIDFVKAA
jgi:microcystin degradation protein MlrC